MDKNSVNVGTEHSGCVAAEPPRPAQGWRITMTVEGHSAEMLDWGFHQALAMGREMYIGVEVSHRDDSTARVKVRTTKLRKKVKGL